MLAPKCATYNGRSTFANPKYLKIAQSEKPRLYEIPYDTSDPANRFCPNGEETVTLEKESRSKLDKDKVKPYDYTYQNSLYETFKPPSKTYLDQLEHAKTVRKTIIRMQNPLRPTKRYLPGRIVSASRIQKDRSPQDIGNVTPTLAWARLTVKPGMVQDWDSQKMKSSKKMFDRSRSSLGLHGKELEFHDQQETVKLKLVPKVVSSSQDQARSRTRWNYYSPSLAMLG
ncbi:hypothetical protein Tco_0366200 [Tanacetum coccineum]